MFVQSLMKKATPKISEKRGVLKIITSVALKGTLFQFRTTVFHFFARVKIYIGDLGELLDQRDCSSARRWNC